MHPTCSRQKLAMRDIRWCPTQWEKAILQYADEFCKKHTKKHQFQERQLSILSWHCRGCLSCCKKPPRLTCIFKGRMQSNKSFHLMSTSHLFILPFYMSRKGYCSQICRAPCTTNSAEVNIRVFRTWWGVCIKRGQKTPVRFRIAAQIEEKITVKTGKGR